MIVDNKDAIKTRNQTYLFHQKTFAPSKKPNGIKLSKATKALIRLPHIKAVLSEKVPIKRLETKKVKKSIKFTRGPESDVLPIISLLASPDTITVPGETIFIGEKIEIRVIIMPKSVSLNSAHKP